MKNSYYLKYEKNFREAFFEISLHMDVLGVHTP